MLQKYLECARITSTHGVRGTVRLECRADSPKTLCRLSKMYILDKQKNVIKTLTVTHASVQKNMVLATFAEIDSLEAAIPYRDTVLYADRKDIPLAPGAHFIADLIGLPVKHADTGALLGTLVHVDSRAHGDLYTVKTPNGEALLPAVPEFVIRLDPDDGVYVRPIPGLLDGGEEQV